MLGHTDPVAHPDQRIAAARIGGLNGLPVTGRDVTKNSALPPAGMAPTPRDIVVLAPPARPDPACARAGRSDQPELS